MYGNNFFPFVKLYILLLYLDFRREHIQNVSALLLLFDSIQCIEGKSYRSVYNFIIFFYSNYIIHEYIC